MLIETNKQKNHLNTEESGRLTWKAVKTEPWMKRDTEVLQLVCFIDYIIQRLSFINWE